jgi:hypothetical protein
MIGRIPTRRGDVLILRTVQSFTIHVVGRVSEVGQQDFHGHTNLKYVSDYAATEAKALVVPGRRIFFQNIDTGDWSEIST